MRYRVAGFRGHSPAVRTQSAPLPQQPFALELDQFVTPFDDNLGDTDPVAVVVSTRRYAASDLIAMLVRSRFTSAERGPSDALAFVDRLRPEVVVAVIDSSRFSDLELLRSIIRSTDAVVLVLAPSGDMQAAALRAGADIFLRDSDGPEAVEAQLKAVRRRLRPEGRLANRGASLVAGPLVIDMQARRVRAGDVIVPLTNMEFSLLAALVSNAGRVLSPVEATRLATGRLIEEQDASQTVKVYVRRLRHKLEAAGVTEDVIANVRGRGYIWDPLPSTNRATS